MPTKLVNIPTNLIMGFLGVGKTTAIIDLLKQKPANEKWAVLVNEFGSIGIDGDIFSATGAIAKEIPGGCLCCAVGMPFQVGLNSLIKQVRPDRLLIEPSGLGHPKKVLDLLVGGSFKNVLDMRASICLLDPEKLKNTRYTNHESFVDQIALSDVLIANKTDLADKAAIQLFHRWAKHSNPQKAVISQTIQGQLDSAWLDVTRNPERCAIFPNAHRIINNLQTSDTYSQVKADNYQSFGQVFPSHSRFDYQQLHNAFSHLKAERIKGVFYTGKDWFLINCVDGKVDCTPCSASANSRIEIIAMGNDMQDITTALNKCRTDAFRT
ncbi:MAG: GTP-binding protein [Methylococcales bacterium]